MLFLTAQTSQADGARAQVTALKKQLAERGQQSTDLTQQLQRSLEDSELLTKKLTRRVASLEQEVGHTRARSLAVGASLFHRARCSAPPPDPLCPY